MGNLQAKIKALFQISMAKSKYIDDLNILFGDLEEEYYEELIDE